MPNIRSMTWEQFHEYLAPSPGCECDLCEMYRLLDEWDDWAHWQGFTNPCESYGVREVVALYDAEHPESK